MTPVTYQIRKNSTYFLFEVHKNSGSPSKIERGVKDPSNRGQLTRAIKAYSIISLYVGSQRQHKGNCLVATHWPHQGLNYRPAGSKCSPRLGPVSKLAASSEVGGCRAFDSPLSLLWRQQLALKWVQS